MSLNPNKPIVEHMGRDWSPQRRLVTEAIHAMGCLGWYPVDGTNEHYHKCRSVAGNVLAALHFDGQLVKSDEYPGDERACVCSGCRYQGGTMKVQKRGSDPADEDHTHMRVDTSPGPPDLTKTRTVLTRRGWHEDGGGQWRPDFNALDHLPEAGASRLTTVLLDRDVYEDMGRPDQITVTVRPGDHLNP